MTALGRVRLGRQYVTGPDGGRYPADAALGVDGYLSAAAERMAVLAGVRQPFAKAERLLAELSGWDLDDDTIRRVTHAASRRATAGRAERGDAGRFARAGGGVEVAIDAGKVNTTGGWRDVKVAVFARRRPGPPATPAAWGERELPAPGARAVVAHIEESGAFAARVRAEADRLRVTTAADVTVLGDGAEWVWALAADVLPQAAGVLDIYHAIEHLGGAAKAVWGEGTGAAAAQLGAGRAALLAGGKAGVERWLGEAFGAVPAGASADPLLEAAAYFAKHPTRLGYAGRLAAGRSIGSGLAEGGITQMVKLRLKRTGARWRAEHVGPLVEMIALADTPDWHPFWTAA